jgi:ParG
MMATRKPEGMVELNGYVPQELKREFKLACTAIDRTMGDVLTELIQNWLQEQKKEPK